MSEISRLPAPERSAYYGMEGSEVMVGVLREALAVAEPTPVETAARLHRQALDILESCARTTRVNGEPALVTPEPVEMHFDDRPSLFARLAIRLYEEAGRTPRLKLPTTIRTTGHPSVIFTTAAESGPDLTTVKQYFSPLAIRHVLTTGGVYVTVGTGYNPQLNQPAHLDMTENILGHLAFANGLTDTEPARTRYDAACLELPVPPRPRRVQSDKYWALEWAKWTKMSDETNEYYSKTKHEAYQLLRLGPTVPWK